MIGGLRQGMGYCGAKDIRTLQESANFIQISGSGLRENHPHGVEITKQAPNYTTGNDELNL
jgi:IMP dehydrogenase